MEMRRGDERVNSIEWVTDIGYRESLERMQIDLNVYTVYSIQYAVYSMQYAVYGTHRVS